MGRVSVLPANAGFVKKIATAIINNLILGIPGLDFKTD
jgi:hypothetical protein